VGKDLLRTFNKEFTLSVVGWLEKRGRNGPRFCAPNQLFGRSPIRTAAVERIEDDVTARFRIEPLDELARRVIDDRGMSARLDLAEHLHNDRRLAAAGVADNLDVLVFAAFWDAQKVLALVHFDPDSGALDSLVELLRRNQDRPLQTPAILDFFPPPDVLGDRPGKLHEEEDSSQDKLQSKDP
jgi:hypothetical protein